MFFDFAAAFPSLSHEFLHACLEHLGLPRSFRNFVRALYTGNDCLISAGGETHAGFSIRAGIRQGCPLSPLLFALVMDPFLRLLLRKLPGDTFRAYADDIAMVVRNLKEAAKVAAPAFAAFAMVSGLTLNLAKTVVVPLGDERPEQVRDMMETVHPGWGAAVYQEWAEYLGFTLGPGRGERGWSKALLKYEERARLWAALGLGLFFTTVAYNVYVASLLGFILQLDTLPSEWPQREAATLRELVPGPYRWINSQDLHGLRRDFALPQEFIDLKEVSVAARFRVLHREAAAAGGLRAKTLARKLQNEYMASDYVARCGRWREWFGKSFAQNLAEADAYCQEQGVTIDRVEETVTRAAPRPWTLAQTRRARGSVQKCARVLLSTRSASNLQKRLRHKLSRWQLPIFERIRVTRAMQVISRLAKTVPPRVQSAILRTWYNGWCTSRRFQRLDGGTCMFGCSAGADSIEHYACCKHIVGYWRGPLRLPDPGDPPTRRLMFMLLDRDRLNTEASLTCMALLVAAVYALHCKARQGALNLPEPEDVRRALAQAVREAASGHPRALKTLDSIWATRRT